MSSSDPPKQLPASLRTSWHGFLELFEPLRPDLYRYCRYLSQSPWDAEDLAQDALARAFVTLGKLGEAPPNPRAWLLRVASNLWIDTQRRRREASLDALDAPHAVEPRAAREAAGTLLSRLSPQERAALVLKDVFELSLEETAEALETTVGAVKAALSRGRGRLGELEPAEPRPLARGVLDEFCDAFNARDMARLTALLLDSATVEVVGATTEYGPERARRGVLFGMLYGSERLAEAATRGGIEARFVQSVLPASPRLELRLHRGEALLLSWYQHQDGEAVRAVTRVEISEGRVCRLQNYFFNPDFLSEVCRELDVPCRVNGYRFWLSGC
ncbi:MAG: RNA polymerase sigma factor [Polyangiaceae bacterium]